MLKWMLLALLAVSSGNAAADSLKPAPPRGADPFANILDRAALKRSEGSRLDGVGSKRIAVILSDATEAHLKWCEEASHGWTEATNARMRAFHGQGYLDRYTRLHHEAYDPAKVVAAAVDPLVRKAGSVEVIGNLSEFVSGGFDLLAVVDITFVNTIPTASYYLGAKNKAGLYMNVYFVDRNNALVGSVESGETRKVRMPPHFMDDAIEMRTSVLASYQASMDALLGADKPVAAPPAVASSLPASEPRPDASGAAARLQEIDALLRQGLITPGEAEAKRKQILERL